MAAKAFAGLNLPPICKVPPVMLCNPKRPAIQTSRLRIILAKASGSSPMTGAVFTVPETSDFSNRLRMGVRRLVRPGLGRASCRELCLGKRGDTKTRNMVSVRDALNTRFDVYDNGLNQACGKNGSLCPPSMNTRKDLVRKGNSCGLVDNTGNANEMGFNPPSRNPLERPCPLRGR